MLVGRSQILSNVINSYRENFHCTKIHPVNNEIVNLLIPNEAAETGLSGELQLVPIAALDPCLKMYPNRPAQISEISIFVYSTLGLPVLIHSRKKPLPFFEDSVHVAEWLMFNSDVKLHLDTIQEEGKASPDIRYKVQHGCEQLNQRVIVEQTLLLFLFINFSDRFQSELLDLIEAHRLLEYHTESLFHYNQQIMKGAIQSLLKSTLAIRDKAERNQEKLQLSHPVMADSIYSIVTNSTNSSFRRQCLHNFQVSDSQQLKQVVLQSLQRTCHNRVLMNQTCHIQKQEDDTWLQEVSNLSDWTH